MKVSKKLFAHKRVRVCVLKGVGDISDRPPPTAPPTSRMSHPGLLLGGGAVWSQLLWGWAPTVVELADYNK